MQFLKAVELSGLHSEQRALVDFLVLAAGRRFVGFEESTFSLFVREWRYLHGRPRSSSALVAAAVPDYAGQVGAHCAVLLYPLGLQSEAAAENACRYLPCKDFAVDGTLEQQVFHYCLDTNAATMDVSACQPSMLGSI